jgi:Transglutaminase-like superfamily
MLSHLARLCAVTALFCFCTFSLSAQNDPAVAAIWSKIEKNDFKTAISELKALVKKNPSNQEALASLVILGEVLADAKPHEQYFNQLQAVPDVDPALVYSLLYSTAGLGETGVMEGCNLANLEGLIRNAKAHPTNQAYALNFKAYEQIFTWKSDSAALFVDRLKILENWSFLGHFEDEMNSAFEKPHDALNYPDSAHVFTNENGTKLKWFEPDLTYRRGLIIKRANFEQYKKLTFAQTFVDVATEGNYLFSLGYSGNLKVWIDDVLVHSVKDTKLSMYDAYNYKIKLSKGTHRVLVQFGSYNSGNQSFAARFREINTGAPVAFEHQPFQKTYAKGTLGQVTKEEHFAIKSLEANAKKQPNSLYRALLLANGYNSLFDMTAMSKLLQAERKRLENSAIVELYLIKWASRTDNDVELAKYRNKFKELQPHAFAVLSTELDEAMENDNKTRALAMIDTIEMLYPDLPKLELLTLQRHVIEGENMKIIDEIRKLYKKNRYSPELANSMYRVLLEIDGNEREAIKLLENQQGKYYNERFFSMLKEYYQKNGQANKYTELADQYYNLTGGIDAYINYEKADYLHSKKRYKEAQAVLDEIALTRPYDAKLHERAASMFTDQGQKDKAKAAYARAIEIIPYSLRLKNKVYKLDYNKEIYDEIEMLKPETELAAYKKANKNVGEGHDYTIVFDEEAYFQLGKGASATVRNYMAHMHTQEALESFQQMSFGGETVEKAQIFKKNGQKIDAERTGGNIVFTGLEIGDFVYVRYRNESEIAGSVGRFFSHSFGFGGYRPTIKNLLHVFIDTTVAHKVLITNGNYTPKVRTLRQYKISTYEDLNPPLIPIEPYSPAFVDVAPTVHIGSDAKWADIVNWYDNLTNIQSDAEFDDQALMAEIFPKGLAAYNSREKAVEIYNYIIKNIQYSSISFRQSGIIPQAAADVYHTKIGDCKDVSTLYKSIANKAGLKANLVLISNASNGAKEVVLPGLGFDHCIVQVDLDGKPQYLELTSGDLAFGTLGMEHYRANVLDISQEKANVGIKQLTGVQKELDYVRRSSKVQITSSQEAKIECTSTYGGSDAARFRGNYYEVLPNLQKENLTKALSRVFTNGAVLNSYELADMKDVKPNYQQKTNATVSKALIKIGSAFTFKLPFGDQLFTAEHFAEEERKNVFCIDRYETTEVYEETFDITLDPGFQFDELPENATLNHLDMEYSLSFTKQSAQKLTVTRKFKASKFRVPAAEFGKLRTYANSVIELENTYLAIKKVK